MFKAARTMSLHNTQAKIYDDDNTIFDWHEFAKSQAKIRYAEIPRSVST